jgi:hypothetical protein
VDLLELIKLAKKGEISILLLRDGKPKELTVNFK